MDALKSDDVAAVLQALDALPAGLEPLDASAIDGFLTGITLQRIALGDTWRLFVDPDGRAPNINRDEPSVRHLLSLLESRRARLDAAIEQRSWFDPWLFEAEPDAVDPVREACAPWAAGFALAMDHAPGLMALDHPDLIDALALVYVHFDADDLEDADDLLASIAALEPAADLAAAVEDLVTATLLLADISRPRPQPTRPRMRPASGPRRRG
jgi:uncharacterized protein